MESSKTPNKAVIGIVVVALLAIAATAVIVLGANGNETAQDNSAAETVASTSTSPEASASTSPSTSTEATAESSTAAYKSGTYTATGSYQTPGGRESIGVTVTLSSDGTITDASVSQQGQRGESQEYQAKFASGFKSLVVGKKIDSVSLTRVAGSSLTPNGFNNAINSIESQAQA